MTQQSHDCCTYVILLYCLTLELSTHYVLVISKLNLLTLFLFEICICIPLDHRAKHQHCGVTLNQILLLELQSKIFERKF